MPEGIALADDREPSWVVVVLGDAGQVETAFVRLDTRLSLGQHEQVLIASSKTLAVWRLERIK